MARLAGNLLAVVLVPIALIGSEREAGLVLVVAVLSAVAFRYFTGNYVLGSFGIAGTVLVLDQTLNYILISQMIMASASVWYCTPTSSSTSKSGYTKYPYACCSD